MKKFVIFCFSLVLAVSIMGVTFAESILMDGIVVNIQPQPIVSTADGTIQHIHVNVGDQVAEGDAVAAISTNKVYATTDGTVYLFGTPGEQIHEIVMRYGAAAYISPSKPYTITSAAVDRNGRIVSVTPGEKVYLRCYKDGKHKGTGILAKPENGKYTVLVTEGEFIAGETISIYRDPLYTDQSRIGRAKIKVKDLVAYRGSGYLVKFHVQNGDEVKKGTLLYETISGAFAPGTLPQEKIISPDNGIISAIYETEGTQLFGSPSPLKTSQNIEEKKEETTEEYQEEVVSFSDSLADAHVIAELYPDSGLRIIAHVPESVINEIHVKDIVSVSPQFAEKVTVEVDGSIEKISRMPVPNGKDTETQYAVYIVVSDASDFYYGMHVTVSAIVD